MTDNGKNNGDVGKFPRTGDLEEGRKGEVLENPIPLPSTPAPSPSTPSEPTKQMNKGL